MINDMIKCMNLILKEEIKLKKLKQKNKEQVNEKTVDEQQSEQQTEQQSEQQVDAVALVDESDNEEANDCNKESDDKSKYSFFPTNNGILKFITFIGGGGVVLQFLKVIINNVFQMTYQTICSNFYNIPGEYFTTDLILSVTKIILTFLIVLVLFGYKKVLLKVHKADTLLYKLIYACMDAAMAVTYGYVILTGVLTIIRYIAIKKYEWAGAILSIISKHVYPILIGVVIISILTALYCNNLEIIKKVKNKFVKITSCVLGNIGFFITMCIFAVSVLIANNNDVQYKTGYEIITYNSEEYVVLNKEDEKYLIVEFYEDGTDVILFTNNYRVVDGEGMNLRYKKWNTIPVIDTVNSKDEYLNKDSSQ